MSGKTKAIERARLALAKRKEEEENKKSLLGKEHLAKFYKENPHLDKIDIKKSYLCASAVRLKECPQEESSGRVPARLVGEDYFLDFFGEGALAENIEKIPRGDFKFPEDDPRSGNERTYTHYQLLFIEVLSGLTKREASYDDNHFLMNFADRSTMNLVAETCEEYLGRICARDAEKGYIMPRECKKVKFSECDELVEAGVLLDHCAFWINWDEDRAPRVIYLNLVDCSKE